MQATMLKLILPQVTKFASKHLSEYSRYRREERFRQAALACECPVSTSETLETPVSAPIAVGEEGRNSYLFTLVGLILGLAVGTGLYYLKEYSFR